LRLQRERNDSDRSRWRQSGVSWPRLGKGDHRRGQLFYRRHPRAFERGREKLSDHRSAGECSRAASARYLEPSPFQGPRAKRYIRTAIKNCTGDYAIIQDADLEYDPAEIPRFVEKALSDGADAVYGSRTIGGKVKYIYARNYWGVRFLTSLTNLLFKARYTDVATASKMVRTSVLKSLNLRCSGFDLDFELSNKLAKRRRRVIEIPITYRPRSIAEGKKIRAKDGLSALFQILKDRILRSPSRKGPPRP
jgi:hypothetical protein